MAYKGIQFFECFRNIIRRRKSKEASEFGVQGMKWGEHRKAPNLDQEIDSIERSLNSTKDPNARKVLYSRLEKARDRMKGMLKQGGLEIVEY